MRVRQRKKRKPQGGREKNRDAGSFALIPDRQPSARKLSPACGGDRRRKLQQRCRLLHGVVDSFDVLSHGRRFVPDADSLSVSNKLLPPFLMGK